jgi:endonuclease/exonuclease/phosphatase family metal-dependent hydrolase
LIRLIGTYMLNHQLRSVIVHAPISLGAFFCLLAATLAGCSEKKEVTEKWQSAAGESAAGSATAPPAQPIATEPDKPAPAPAGQGEETRFLAYNLKNYLSMRRYIDGTVVYTPKPREEIQALISIIHSAKPDILGVCEIGNDADLKDLQARLRRVGIDLPYSHRVQGSDRARALAILSRHPIIATHVPKELNYRIQGVNFAISRGILDATIQLPRREVRFIGVHFKSKRPIKEADQSLMRRNESLLLRQHIDDILSTNPDTPLLVYGDFNDTKNSRAVSAVRGRPQSDLHLEMIKLNDSRGENWTHYWQHEDIYSRIDFIMANPKLAAYIHHKGCKLLTPGNWQTASDHRPMLVLIR